MTISVLIVDDDPLVRSALGLMLGGQPDVRVVGEASDGRAGLAAVRELRPDGVLRDIRMPVLDGLAATVELRAGAQPPHVIVLTTFDADDYVLRLAKMLKRDLSPKLKVYVERTGAIATDRSLA